MTTGKQEILDLIRRFAAEDGGNAPGEQTFKSLTGIGKSEWNPRFWLRWGDAVRDAGLPGNPMFRSHDHEFLIKKYIEVIRELQRFPIEGELIRKRLTDDSFPTYRSFAKLGGKKQRAERILQFCRMNEGYDDVMPFCETVASSAAAEPDEAEPDSPSVGYVYLLKHGARREYKIGRTKNPLRREGEIGIELPEKVQPVHVIKTDDPFGIEAYWHFRFADKRKSGEWFALTAEDVRAFKRWKRIF